MIQVSVVEAQRCLPDLLDAVKAGEAVSIIGGDGQSFHLAMTASESVVDPEWPGYPHPGSARGLIVMHDDFDAPLDELKEYME